MANGSLGMAKPCHLCLDVIKALGVKKVFYTNESGEIVMEYVSNMTTDHKCRGEVSLMSS